jgi:hypothetical protein
MECNFIKYITTTMIWCIAGEMMTKHTAKHTTGVSYRHRRISKNGREFLTDE